MKQIRRSPLRRIGCGVLAAVMLLPLAACGSKEEPNPGDPDYLKTVSAHSFWKNDAKTSVPQYRIYNHIQDFLSGGTVRDGDVVGPDGRVKKVLFLGFDGMRADAVANVVFDAENFDTNGYNAAAPLSGINEAARSGGAYLAYCGGETGTETEQTTSTSASWTSILTGAWGSKHGIKTNDDTKNMEYKTILLQYAEKGLQTSLAFDWDQYLDVNLREEVAYVMARPEIQMTFCDIDRQKAEKLKKTRAQTLELFNFVAPEHPSEKAPYDAGMRDYLLGRIEAGDDLVAGIFHNIDSNGHTYGFSNSDGHYVNSVRNCDAYAYELMQALRERESTHGEQWLVVMANDHGGIGTGHGGQTLEERTTWIVSNIALDEQYYADGYDGYRVK